MARYGWLLCLGLACALLALQVGRASHVRAAPKAQIVMPDDVATPTATYTIILVPTATPTPTPIAAMQPNQPAATVGATSSHAAQGASTYVVQAGDTLLTVALEVGLDVAEMPCAIAPAFEQGQPLVIGDVLEIPPAGWQCYQASGDESLTQIAARFGLDPLALIEVPWNQLDAASLGEAPLAAGRYLRVPPAVDAGSGFLNFMLDQPVTVSPMTAYAIGGTKPRTSTLVGPLPKDWPYGSGNFMWPVFGWLSQGYRGDHRAIDIAAPPGAFVTAADRGVVVRAGWNHQGYGMFVVIDHNIDYITLYAHLTELLVKEGEVVAQGQIIGTIGSTGNSTGPHLHFEIRDFGRLANPLDYLLR